MAGINYGKIIELSKRANVNLENDIWLRLMQPLSQLPIFSPQTIGFMKVNLRFKPICAK